MLFTTLALSGTSSYHNGAPHPFKKTLDGTPSYRLYDCTDAPWCTANMKFWCLVNTYVKENCPSICDDKCDSGVGSTPAWGEWGPYGDCSAPCDGGTQTRERVCTVMGLCPGLATETRNCNEQPCGDSGGNCEDTPGYQCPLREQTGQCDLYPIVRERCKVSCKVCEGGGVSPTPTWSQWDTVWGACSEECGGGTQSRSRTCSQPGQCPGSDTESRDCNVQSCKEYSDWSSYGRCDASCGGGLQSRTRICITGSCDKHLRETRNCNTQECPSCAADIRTNCVEWKNLGYCVWVMSVCATTCGDCVASGPQWSAFGPCSVNCGVGLKTRTKGSVSQSITCILPDCDPNAGTWDQWGVFDTCTKACGTGSQTRTRTCSKPGTCAGSASETRDCQTQPCQGTWTNWSVWTPCTDTCDEDALSERTRICQGPGTCTGNSRETRPCNTNPCPGTWDTWSLWTDCDVTCGTGEEERTRTCMGPGQCVGDARQTRSCTNQPCPGVWTMWTVWDGCSVTCGGGDQERTRICQGPGQCVGVATEMQSCNGQACPEYTIWTRYGACSDTCGGGVHSRTRICNFGSCDQHLEEIKNCNEQSCGSSCAPDVRTDCVLRDTWGQCDWVKQDCATTCGHNCVEAGPSWSAFGPCSVRCGVGLKTRSKGAIQQSITCIITGCDPNAGYWSDWGPYGPCDKTCGGGSHSRARTCSKPGTCPGNDMETKACGTQNCPVWGDWTDWGTCTKSCDTGEEKRTRVCIGTGTCDGDSEEVRPCNTQDCPVWTDWTPWDSCTKTCGTGEEKRRRQCSQAGLCAGAAEETRPCATDPCPGSWSDWTTWSDCDKPCGSGQQSRTRTCPGPGQCAGDSQQIRQCNAQACNTGWSACSVTCGDGISKKLDPVTGLYSTVHCSGPDCVIPDSCPSGEERRFKVPHECCKKTSATGKWCDRPAASSYKFVRRIIGGDNSVRGDFPWMVFFSGTGACGGAIISKKHILTAAHCIRTDSGQKNDPLVVYAGMAELNDAGNRKELKVARSFAHPDYKFPENDIAILELEEEIQYNLYMRPICLPHGEKPSYDTTCIAMGWGISVNGVRTVTNVLQNVDIKVLDPDVCIHGYLNSESQSLKDLGATLQTRPAVLCAGDLVNEKDSCSGDSGSPLVCQRCDSCGWFVAGVVSFGPTPCAMKGVPGVYTDVVGYEDWIYTTTGITKETRGC